MAIAFVGAGTPLSANTGVVGYTQAVPLPTGYTVGNLLVLLVGTDDIPGPTVPAGWTRLAGAQPLPPTVNPYAPYPALNVFYRIATGTEGTSVNVSMSSADWPDGDAFMVAVTLAYSGTDTATPFGENALNPTTATSASLAHPAITTSVANEWPLTVRLVSTNGRAPTFTLSGASDTKRVDFTDAYELGLGVWDSAAGVTAGAQPVRTTTSSTVADFGSVAATLAIRPPSPSIAVAGAASAAVEAYDATVTTVDGPWDLCDTMPVYSFAVDWSAQGCLAIPGAVKNANPYFVTLADWTPTNATMTLSSDLAPSAPRVLKLTAGTGSIPRIESGFQPVVAGQQYQARGWIWTPSALADGVQVNINWFDASRTYITTSSNAGPATPGTWTLLDQMFSAPAGASYATAVGGMNGTPGAGAVAYFWGLILADPNAGGTFADPSPTDDVTTDITDDGVTISYGRDDNRQLSPPKTGSASFTLTNKNRTYSPENVAGPLYGDLDPARETRGVVSFLGQFWPLMYQRVDDFTVTADYDDRAVAFTFLDGLNLLAGFQLSTEVLSGMRTGALVDYILDQVGWTGGRDIDPGATVVSWWWVEGTDAMTAVNDLVKSEGPPAVAYVAPDNTFVFRDRHHRLLRPESTTPQATFSAAALGECTQPPAPGLTFTAPFTYENGWKNVVNTVSFTVSERAPDTVLSPVWTSDAAISLTTGQTVSITASGSDPFLDAVTPVAGLDYTLTGSGTAQVTLSRTSGQSAVITILAVGSPITITGLQLRGRLVSTRNTVAVSQQDAGSVSAHGARAYNDTAPWAGANDALAVAEAILLHYAKRRPTVTLRVTAKDGAHLRQILQRTVSDRIHIVNGEMGLDDDFFIENVTHTIQRMNNANGQPPVHAVTFGCEKEVVVNANPFRFDVRGAGFDQGVFDQIGSSDPSTVFVFGDPSRGVFDVGTFGL